VINVKRSFIITCLLVMVLTTMVVAGENKVLQIDTHGNAYANLYRSIEFPGNAEVITLQYKIRNKDLTSNSWGPAVLLYWDNLDAVGLRLSTSTDQGRYRIEVGRLMRLGLGTDAFMTPGDTWAEVKVVVDRPNFHVYLYCRNLGDNEWTLVHDDVYPEDNKYDSRFFSRLPQGIVIGTGYVVGRTGTGSAPYLRNSYDTVPGVTPGIHGTVYFDDIQIKADDKVIFSESFDISMDELVLKYDIESEPVNPDPVFQVTGLDK
jgi:hypothetical protein